METVVYQLAQGLAHLGFDVRVMAPSRSPGTVIEGNVRFDGVRAAIVSNWIQVPSYRSIRELTRGIAWADFVHVHNPYETFCVLASLIALREKKPLAVSLLSPGSVRDHPRGGFRLVGRVEERFLPGILRRADLVHVKNLRDLATVRPLVPHAILIPDGVPDELLAAPREAQLFRERRGLVDAFPLVLFLGRLHPLKGPDHLVRAVALLREGFPLVGAVIAGPDPDRLTPNLERLARELGVGDRVRFLGMISETEKREALDATDLVVVPSLADFVEGFSIAASEAWARGKPVVGYPVGALVARIHDGVNGVLAKAVSPAALAKAMGEALTLREIPVPSDVVGWSTVSSRFAQEYERRTLRPVLAEGNAAPPVGGAGPPN
jgi:glycosyltransferase involved in cell wall biosynthesis